MKITKFPGELIDKSIKTKPLAAMTKDFAYFFGRKSYHSTKLTTVPLLPYSKLNKTFFGYFHPEKTFLDHENK